MKHLIYTLICVFSLQASYAQLVKGWVKDDKSPLAGASIVEKGMPANGTSADETGYFELTLRGTSNVIIVSATGHVTQELSVAGRKDLNIVLAVDKAAAELEDVVVVGYGKQKRVTNTGAVNSIKADAIQRIPTASLQNALTGVVPGFSSQQRSGVPGEDGAAFFIRGQSSLKGDNNPLILVDDIEYSYAQFSRLDANEIETISILKDASTTAIFGIKGANGVVLVTTKRGKVGKPKITVRSDFGLSQPTIFPEVLDAYESAVMYNKGLLNDYNANPNPGDPFVPYFSEEDLELFQNGKDPWGHPNVDWRKTLFRNFSSTSKSNIDISGGSDRVKYFISGGFLWQNGMLKDFGKERDLRSDFYYKRYNYRSNLDIKITKTLDVRLDLYGNVGEKNQPNAHTDIFQDYINFRTLSPFAYNVYNPDGSFSHATISPSLGTENNVVGRLTYNGYNRNFENNMYFSFNGVQKLDFITKGLSLKAVASYSSLQSFNRNMKVPDNNEPSSFPSYSYDYTTGTYKQWNDNVYRIVVPTLGYDDGHPLRTLNLQGFLNYDNRFGSHHVFGMILANKQSLVKWYSSNADDLTRNYIPSNTRGYAARFGYDYKQKYLIEFNGAYNGSDVFAAKKKYGFFPAGSIGWNITEEEFMKDIHWLSRWKIKGSYGIVGSDNIGPGKATAYEHIFAYASGNERGNSAYYPGIWFGTSGSTSVLDFLKESALGNDDVSWEKERKINVGTEIGLFQNKLSFSFDYFNHRRYDIIIDRETISAIAGVKAPSANIGIVKNSGYEVELSYKNKIGKHFNYFVTGNYNYVKNTILEREEPVYADAPWQQSTGNSMGQILVYKFIGFYTEKDLSDPDVAKPTGGTSLAPGDLKYLDYNGDGVINDLDQGYFSSPNYPTTTYGLSLGFTYKKFNFSMLFQGASDFSFRARQGAIQAFLSNMQPIHREAWTPELGDNAKYPRLSVSNTSDVSNYQSTFWMIPGDYIRLKSMEIGYSLPKNWFKVLKFQDARLYATGYNLLTWSKLTKLYQFDPEAASGGDKAVYPPQRTFNVGLSVGF